MSCRIIANQVKRFGHICIVQYKPTFYSYGRDERGVRVAAGRKRNGGCYLVCAHRFWFVQTIVLSVTVLGVDVPRLCSNA